MATRIDDKNNLKRAPHYALAVFFVCCTQNAWAADCSDVSGKSFQDTATLECPGYNPADPTSACPPTNKGALTNHVLNGDCDPPINLRPDLGTGITFTGGGGNTTQTGKCPPGPADDNENLLNADGSPALDADGNPETRCPSIPGIQGAPGGNSTPPGTNPNFNQPAMPLSNGSVGAMACGGGIPLLSQMMNLGGNLSLNANINLGANISIGMPPVNMPNLNITVPSLNVPSLNISAPSISIPNFSVPSANVSLPSMTCPNFNFNLNVSAPNIQTPYLSLQVPSMSIPNFALSIPNLGIPDISLQAMMSATLSAGFSGSLSLPNLSGLTNLPIFSLGIIPFIPDPQINLSMPTLGNIPSFSLPSLTINLPNLCMPSFNASVSMNLDGLNNLLSGNFLDSGGININATSAFNNILGGSACLGSVFQLPQNAISLLVPPTSSSMSFTASTITPPAADSVITLPPGSPVAFNVDVPGSLILPQGGTTVGPSGNVWTLAQNSMIIALPSGAWGGGPGKVVVGTSLGNNQVEFPNNQVGTVTNGQLDMSPFWVCTYDSNNNCNYTFTLAPYVQNFQSAAANPAAPNIAISTSAVIADGSAGAIPTQGLTPPQGSILSIPSGTPVSFSVNTVGAILLPAGGTITGPTGSTVSIPQSGALVSLGNNQAVEGLMLENGQIQLPGNVTASIDSTTGQVTVPAGASFPSGSVLSYPSTLSNLRVVTTEIQVPPGVSLPVNTSASVAMPKAAGR
jgi:hypothetical protein